MCLLLSVCACAYVGAFCCGCAADVRGGSGAVTATVRNGTRNRINVAWAVQAACATGRDRRFHLFSCFRIDVITQSDVTSCRLIYWGVRQFLFKWLSVWVCLCVCVCGKLFSVSCFLSQNAVGQDELTTTQLKTFVISIMIGNVSLITLNLLGYVFFFSVSCE